MSNPLNAYLQHSEPSTDFKPGENGQLIDLDEMYASTDQVQADFMIQGAESLKSNRLDRRLAAILGIESYTQMDTCPTERNAVLGAEGFFSVIYEGFQTFIENIIKYIRMAIDWVADTIKGLFGFRKSQRIDKAIDSKLDNMKTEFEQVLNGLGFPGKEYRLEYFIGNLPGTVDRVGQLTVMRSKFETDKESIEGLSAAIPLFQQTIGELTKSSERAVKAFGVYKRTINDEFQKTRIRKHVGERLKMIDSPEVIRLMKSCAEVNQAFSTDAVIPLLAKLLETLYKVSFSNQELTEGFAKVRKDLDEKVRLEAVKLNPSNVIELMGSVQALNAHYTKVADNSIDMSGINLRDLGRAIEQSDADKMKSMATYYNAPNLISEYQFVAVGVRNYTQFCQLISRQLMMVSRQIDNLVRWHARGYAWFYHALLNDLEKLKELNKEAYAQGYNPMANADGTPTVKFEFIDEADSQTFFEKFGGTSRELLDKDIANLKSIYNTFVKDTGIGRTI